MDGLEKEARKIGAEHGKNAGSWVFDGNTDEATVRKVLTMIADGDPEWEIPAPLSGEWADGMTLGRLAEELGTSEEHKSFDELCTAYEEAYHEAYEDEVVRSGHAMLPEDEDR